jgi:polyisoprenoid-binding protein YceI
LEQLAMLRPPAPAAFRIPLMARLAWLLLLCAGPASAADYLIEPGHTYPSFEIDHLGFSTQRGRFNTTSGRIELDQIKQTGKLDITIETASLDTGHALRDRILLGPDWFDSERFPVILYRASQLSFVGDRLVAVDGELTLRGVTRPLRLEVSRFRCGINLAVQKRACGADAQGVLNRSAYGMTSGLPFVGDEVRLVIQVEAYLQ